MQKGIIPEPFRIEHKGNLTCAEENLIAAFCIYQSEIAKLFNADHLLSQYLALIRLFYLLNFDVTYKAIDDVLEHLTLPINSGYETIENPSSIPPMEDMDQHRLWINKNLTEIEKLTYPTDRLMEAFVVYESQVGAITKLENDPKKVQQLALTRFLFLLEPEAVYKSVTHFVLCPIQHRH